ncbi:MAG: trimethylamine methyltransferase family protein [Alphaproteobacteria bacterium]|nr:trimethylamine methyltransferase family protein [Alphaproteobacteria bacterium]
MPSVQAKGVKSARRGRISRRGERTDVQAPQIVAGVCREIPPYVLTSDEGLERVEEKSNEILQEIGVEFRGDRDALALWRNAGADVRGERVRFDKGMVREIILATAPKHFIQHARNPSRSVLIGDNNVVFAPAYGMPFVRDLDRGRRYGSIADFENIVKLAYVSPWLHHSGGTVCEPVDLPVNKRHLDMVYAHLRWSDKPFMGSVTAPERAEDSIDMARIVFGDDVVDRDCVIMGNINMNSPLIYDQAMSGSLRAYARANQCPVIVPFVLGGATAPVTMTAAVAQAYAEVLVGCALGQLERPGSPAIFGNFVTSVDLRSGSPTFGTPEPALGSYMAAQLARRIGLPIRCSGGFTSSKLPDAQAMQETVNSLNTAVLCGANFVLHAAGWLEGALTLSYEKLVLDADYLGGLHIFLKGLAMDENAFAMDAFHEVGPGNHFFGCAHTLANYERAFYESDLSDTQSFENWRDGGGHDSVMRANAKWKQMLAAYEAPPLDPSIDEHLGAYMAKKKETMPDIWH